MICSRRSNDINKYPPNLLKIYRSLCLPLFVSRSARENTQPRMAEIEYSLVQINMHIRLGITNFEIIKQIFSLKGVVSGIIEFF